MCMRYNIRKYSSQCIVPFLLSRVNTQGSTCVLACLRSIVTLVEITHRRTRFNTRDNITNYDCEVPKVAA